LTAGCAAAFVSRTAKRGCARPATDDGNNEEIGFVAFAVRMNCHGNVATLDYYYGGNLFHRNFYF
jgi:hypothetical protein